MSILGLILQGEFIILMVSFCIARMDSTIYKEDFTGLEYSDGYDNKKFVKESISNFIWAHKWIVIASTFLYIIAKIMIFLGGF